MAVAKSVVPIKQTRMLVAQVPTVLRTELYAVAALVGAAVVVVGRMLQVPDSVAAISGAVLSFGLRFIAMRRGWHLPRARHDDRDE